MKQSGLNHHNNSKQQNNKKSNKLGSVYYKKNSHQKNICKMNEDSHGKGNKLDQDIELYQKSETNTEQKDENGESNEQKQENHYDYE